MKKISQIKIKQFLLTAVCVFAPLFMLFIFGPAEIFFGNIANFDFVWGAFGWIMIATAVIVSAAGTLIICVLPDKAARAVKWVFVGLALAMYLQGLFLDSNMTMMGTNPEGYQISVSLCVICAVVWLLCLILLPIAIVLVIKKKSELKEILDKAAVGVAAFLILIQGAGLISLFITADKTAFSYPEGEIVFSGRDQYNIGKENVILFIVDTFGVDYMNQYLESEPDALSFLNDFTYYTDGNAQYCFTFPSVAHMLTTQDYDPSIAIKDWTKEIWQTDIVKDFYGGLKKEGYERLVFPPGSQYVYAGNSLRDLTPYIDNLSSEEGELKTDYFTGMSAMLNMSMYKYMPEFAKGAFYVDSYSEKVRYTPAGAESATVKSDNFEYYEGLKDNGLTVKYDKCFSYIHILGMHNFLMDENVNRVENGTLEQNAAGCMTILRTYIEELKKNGVYDDTAIIITADHPNWSICVSPVFFVKEKNAHHDSIEFSNLPIEHNQILPTLAKWTGVSSDSIDSMKTIYDAQEEDRQHRLQARPTYVEGAYPDVMTYVGGKKGSSNIYYTYPFTGDPEDHKWCVVNGTSVATPLVDSFD